MGISPREVRMNPHEARARYKDAKEGTTIVLWDVAAVVSRAGHSARRPRW
jgi:hypothetical protein